MPETDSDSESEQITDIEDCPTDEDRQTPVQQPRRVTRPQQLPRTQTEEDTGQFKGYSIVWDNVGKLVTSSQQGTGKQNTYAIFANCLMIGNRINFRNLEDNQYKRKAAVTIPPEDFMPGETDWEALKTRMNVLVQRCLVTHISGLQPYQNKVTWHIQHQFTEESKKKSDVVSIELVTNAFIIIYLIVFY